MEKNSIFNNTLISAYVLLLSTAYLWGFWSYFDINILNYIGVTDIIKSVIWPMIVAIIIYFMQVAINVFNSPKSFETADFSSKPTNEKANILLRYSYLVFMMVITIGIVLYNLISGDKMQRYISIGWFLSLVIYFTTCTNAEILEKIPFKNKQLFYSLICFLPIIFLSQGVYEGGRIISGKNTFLLESNAQCTSSAHEKYRYIDAISDKAFALSLKDNSICIFKYEYLKLTKEHQASPNK